MRDLTSVCIRPEVTIHEAMQCIDGGGKGIALVTDDDAVLLGTVTDGDIRRALLGGGTLTSPVAPYMHTEFVAVGPQEGRAAALDLMRARLLRHIPIVDADGRLVGVHLLREVLGAEERPNWAVVMAGGKGTRLRPITEDLPKPMIKVAGRPILERLVLHLVRHGIRRIFLSVNYLSQMIEDHFGNGHRFGCRIEYLHEDEPLGTGGSLSLLPGTPDRPVLVMNGDLVTQMDVGSMIDFHEDGPQVATLGVREYYHRVPLGCVVLDGSFLMEFEEKPVLARTINAGAYVLDPDVVGSVPTESVDLPDLLKDCLARREQVAAFRIESEWVDVGRPEQLTQAQNGTAG